MEARKYGLADAARLCLKASPGCASLMFLIYIARGLQAFLTAIVTSSFIDGAMEVLAGTRAAGEMLLPAALVAGVVGLYWLIDQLDTLCVQRVSLRLRETYRMDIVEKCAKLEYAHVEDPKTWDLISRVIKKADENLMNGFSSMLNAMGLILSVVSVVGLLLAHVWWAALVILAFSAPLMALAIKAGRANYQAQRDTERSSRKCNYMAEFLTSREAEEERALFGFSDKYTGEYVSEFKSGYDKRFRIQAKWFARMKGGALLFTLVSVLIASALLQPAISGTITIGLFVSLVNAAFSLVQQMSWTLSYCMQQLASTREYMRDVSEFSALSEAEGALDAPDAKPLAFESLTLKNVSFTYPGTERQVLKGLSLELRAGRHYAFVGVNGAGKTTLTKLITGLYDGFEGEILLNGRDIRSYTQSQLKSLYAIAYQDFARYSTTLKDDIAFGDARIEARVPALMSELGLDEAVSRLPNGLDTQLGKLYEDGSELSGGQWQRLAIARALAREASVRILDEPTAALDPVAESQAYEEFGRASRDATTLFISHRLGSTKLADEIFVLGDGRVLEHGPHEALMARCGLYAEMYEAQRSWYK